MKTKLCAVLCVIAANGSMAADKAPLEIPLTENPATYVTLGKLVVTMERTTLKELASTVGSGDIFSNGVHAHDGGGDEVCYRYGTAIVHFVSNGEFGGPNRLITNFRLVAANDPAARCSALPASLQPVRVVGRIALGDSREAIEHRFNSALGKSEERISYRFSGKGPGSCAEEGYDVGSWLEVSYSSGKVTRMVGGQTSSC